ncbi:MAG TPA: YhdP family protein [Rhodanobacteraceae bacterium]
MSPDWRHIHRRCWFTTGGVLAVLAIVLALLMALGQLLVPLIAHYPHRVAQMLSQKLQRPVSFASMQGHWQPSGPLLVLHQVKIGRRDGQPALVLPSAKVKLDFGALIRPSRHWINLRLSGLKLTLRRSRDGHWHVAGFGVAGTKPGAGQHLKPGDLPGNLWLDDLQLDIDDARTGRHYQMRVGPLRVDSGGGQVRFAGVIRRGTSNQALRLAGRIGDGAADGQLYLGVSKADLGDLLGGATAAGYAVKSGQGNAAVWLSWHDRQISDVTADINLRNLDVTGPAGEVKAAQLVGLARLQHQAGQWNVLFAPGAKGSVRARISGHGKTLHVLAKARNLETGAWAAMASLAPGVSTSLGHWLAAAAPGIHVSSAWLDWSGSGGLQALHAQFDHLHLAAADRRPGVNDLHGSVLGDAEAVSLQLPAQPLTLDFAKLFRQPLTFSRVAGHFAVWRGAAAWHLATGGLHFKGKALAGELRGGVALPRQGGSPILNMSAVVAPMPLVAARQFLPVGIMPENAVKWLDHGLLGGTLDGARVVVRGATSDWPFTNHKGRFEAHADISGLDLKFDPHWPGANGIHVGVDFVDNGMLALVDAGGINGIKVHDAVASIPDFGQTELILNASGNGSGGAMMGLVRGSPIGKPHADVLDNLTLGGNGDFDFAMVVPLSKRAPSPFTLGGTVHLHDADVDAKAWGLSMQALNGPLHFNAHGFETHGLTALYQGQPVSLAMAIGPQTGHADWPFKVDVRGNFSLAQLVAGRPELASVGAMGHGSAPFDIAFHIDNAANNPLHANQVLTVRSNLQGLALDLPAPLAKPAQTLLPLDMQMGFPVAGSHMRVILGNRLFALARLPAPDKPWAVDVRVGGLAPATPLPASGIRVRGSTANLDVSGWVRWALSAMGSGQGAMPPIDVDVATDVTHIFGQAFSQLHLKLQQNATQLAVNVDGPAIQGDVTVPVHDLGVRGIVARFKRLYWPKPAAASEPAAVPATASSVAAAVPTAQQLAQQAADVGVAPSSLPPLHVWVGDLRFGDAHLGQVRLETHPTSKGMRIGMLRAQSPSLYMTATGDWDGTAHASQTRMAIDFNAASLGNMLDALGYEGIFTGGQTHAHLDASWPGAPSSFALANVEGTLGVKIGEGRIPDVKPGVGRLFGLMSIVDLPRRLTLDFGDVFGKGLGFDSISGHFRFHDGNAYTSDFTLKGPSVNVTVTGRVGFRTHDYDQHVLAIPHIGNSLPIVGAAVAGPLGVVAGLAVQGLLGKGLNKAASVRYHITGPWDKPTITKEAEHVPPARRGSAVVPGARLPAPVAGPTKASPAPSSPLKAAPAPASPSSASSAPHPAAAASTKLPASL